MSLTDNIHKQIYDEKGKGFSMKQFENVFETMAGGMNGINVVVGPQKRSQRIKQKVVNGYTYNDTKESGNWDLDRIRTFIKTEVNPEPNGDPNQVFYSVDVGDTKKDGKFYALKCHLGSKKQKTIRKAYTVEELVKYFFGPISEDDFNNGSEYQYFYMTDKLKARRYRIWNQFYSRQAWRLRMKR